MKSYVPILAGSVLSGLLGYLALLFLSSGDDAQLFIEFTIAWGVYSSVLFIVQGETIRSVEKTLATPSEGVASYNAVKLVVLLFLVLLSTSSLSAFEWFDRITPIVIILLFCLGISAGLVHRKVAGGLLALGQEFSVGLAAAVEGVIRLMLVVALVDVGQWIFVAIPASSVASLTLLAVIRKRSAVIPPETTKVTWSLDWLLALGFLSMSVVANGALAWISILWGSRDQKQLAELAVAIGIDRAVILLILVAVQSVIFRQMLLAKGVLTFWSNTPVLIGLIFLTSMFVSFFTAAMGGFLISISFEFFVLHIGNSLLGLLVIRSLRFAKMADSRAFLATWMSTSVVFVFLTAMSISSLGPELSFGLAQLISALTGLILATLVLNEKKAERAT